MLQTYELGLESISSLHRKPILELWPGERGRIIFLYGAHILAGRVLLAGSIEVSVPCAPHSISNPVYEFRAGRACLPL